MAKKTPAEIQIEMLKQLKKGISKKTAPRKTNETLPPRAPSVKTPPSGKGAFELSLVKRKTTRQAGQELLPRVKVNARHLKSIRDRLKKSSEFKSAGEFWDWILEFTDSVPFGAASLNQEGQEDLKRIIREWLQQRGLDHD